MPSTTAPFGRDHRRAARVLAEREPVLARLHEQFGPPVVVRPTEPHFANLVRAITSQQLAGASARAIHTRLIGTLGAEVTPRTVLGVSRETLRGVGLSFSKIDSMRDLAEKVLDGTVVLDDRTLGRTSDEDVIDQLTRVRGIGRWTAEVFLLLQLLRLDVWPVGDLGVRRGFALAWEIAVPTAAQLRELGEPYRPYRGVVAWYCWRAYEGQHLAAGPAATRAGVMTGAVARSTR